MRHIGTVIFRLNPFNHCKELFDTEKFQRQHGLEQDPKLRQRNGWCSFSQADVQMPEEEMSQLQVSM
jgi:hypothetical protein